MGGLGQGLGAFFDSYSKTMLERHAQKQQQFQNLMGLAKQYEDTAARLRDQPTWDDNSQTIYNEAMENAHKSRLEAEKVINQKMGGLTKLGGLIKGVMSRGGGQGGGSQGEGAKTGVEAAAAKAAAAVTPGQAPTAGIAPPPEPAGQPAPGYEPDIPPEEAAPPQIYPGGYQAGPLARPGGTLPQMGRPSSMTPPPEPTPAEPALPVDKAAVAPSSISSMSAAGRSGHFQNPYMEAQRARALEDRIAEARAIGDVKTAQQLELEKKTREQAQKDVQTELDYIHAQPGWEALSPQQKLAADMAVRQHQPFRLPSAPKQQRSKEPVQRPDKKWYYEMYAVDPETGERIHQGWEEAGGSAGIRRLNAVMQDKVMNAAYAAGVTDRDEIEQRWPEFEKQVRAADAKIFENKAKISDFKVASEETLAEYRKDRTKYYKEAQELKKKGKAMTPTEARRILDRADIMAQADLKDSSEGDPVAKHDQLVAQSNKWLSENVGLSREELRAIVSGKAVKTPDERAREAAGELTKPPVKKTGEIPAP